MKNKIRYNLKFRIALVFLILQLYSWVNVCTAQQIWTGAISSDWENSANWNGGLPQNGDDIVIDSLNNYIGVLAHPKISTNSTFDPDKITITKGGKLTIQADLTVYGNIKVDNNNASSYVSQININGGIININGDKKLESKKGAIINFTGGTINVTKDLNIDEGTFIMNESDGASTLIVNSDLNNKGKLKVKCKNRNNGLFKMSAGTFTINSGDAKGLELDGRDQGGNKNATLDISGGSFTNNSETWFKKGESDSTLVTISGGTVTLVGDVKDDPGKEGRINIDISGGTLIFQGNFTMEAGDKLIQGNSGTIKFQNSKNWINEGSFISSGDTVIFDGQTTLLDPTDSGNWNFYGIQINIGSSLDQTDPSNINVAGIWSNSGTFNENTKTVTFDGSGLQRIVNSSGETFYNLTMNKSSNDLQLNDEITISNNLILTDGNFADNGNQITGNATGTLTAAAGALLKLGNASNATLFPTNFTNGNITLNSASTVEYKSGVEQTISSIPDYGNLKNSALGDRILPGSVVKIAGKFTSGINSYIITGNTIEYNGSGTQSITVFNYYSLASSSTGNRILPSSGKVRIAGKFTPGANSYTITGSTLVFNGTSAQQISGTNPVTFYDLETNNSSGIILNKAITITNALKLTSGKITTTSTNLLTFDVDATVSGSSSTNFINGPAAKNTNSPTAFTFPIGKDNTYMPLGIEPNNTNATTFIAEYIEDTSAAANNSSLGTGLNKVSNLEHYQLDRSGTADAKVTLYWNSNSKVNGSSLSELRVAHWNGSEWEDMGNSAITGDEIAGSITSATFVTSFSPFSLGTSTSNNPLPVELLYFKADVVDDYVELQWETAAEINNHFFTIERSLNGVDYELLGDVYGAGNTTISQYYSLVDEDPFQGISYYRLKQTDFDGQYEYFSIVSVTLHKNQFELTNIYPNPTVNHTNVEFESIENGDVTLTIYNQLGVEVIKKLITAQEGTNSIVVDVTNLVQGSYYLTLKNNSNALLTSKLIKYHETSMIE